MTPRILGALPALALLLTLAACSPDETAQAPAAAPANAPVNPAPPPAREQPEASAAPEASAEPEAASEPTAAGGERDSTARLSWSVPDAWQTAGPRPMRAATYRTLPAEGDADPGEIAVFYFGPGQGGSVDANVDRWFQQFDQVDGRPTREVAERDRTEINSIPVTLVRANGTYNAAAGPMAPRADMRPGYSLLGAIAEGPEGAVFFKFTGPEATVRQEEERFMTMLQSLQRF
jgi:hypothetical protein